MGTTGLYACAREHSLPRRARIVSFVGRENVMTCRYLCRFRFHEKYWAHYLCSTWNPEGKAICKGDSGGPIFCDPDDKHAQYGVCSNMYNFVKHPFLCGDPVHRSKHVFLYLYQGWIDSFIHPPKPPEPSSDESDDSDYGYYSDDDSDEDEDGDYELEDDERTADKNGGTRGDPFGRGRTGSFRELASVLLTLLWATS